MPDPIHRGGRMQINPTRNRQQLGMVMSITNLVAGVTGFFYQFMSDGAFLTFLVCMTALLGFVNNRKDLDERDLRLLEQSYSTAFMYLFAVVLSVFLFQLFFGKLPFAFEIIAVINAHWTGIMASVMCIFIGLAGIRNYRQIQ